MAKKSMILKPVSYTHLDVYKRQILELSLLSAHCTRWRMCSVQRERSPSGAGLYCSRMVT